MQKPAILDQLIEALNAALAVDRSAVDALFSFRVACNENLAQHPNIQVRQDDTGYSVSMIGILNGLPELKHHRIAALRKVECVNPDCDNRQPITSFTCPTCGSQVSVGPIERFGCILKKDCERP